MRGGCANRDDQIHVAHERRGVVEIAHFRRVVYDMKAVILCSPNVLRRIELQRVECDIAQFLEPCRISVQTDRAEWIALVGRIARPYQANLETPFACQPSSPRLDFLLVQDEVWRLRRQNVERGAET